MQVVFVFSFPLPSYLCEGAASLRSRLKEKQQQFEEVQNGLDLVGFESEVRISPPLHESVFFHLLACA